MRDLRQGARARKFQTHRNGKLAQRIDYAGLRRHQPRTGRVIDAVQREGAFCNIYLEACETVACLKALPARVLEQETGPSPETLPAGCCALSGATGVHREWMRQLWE